MMTSFSSLSRDEKIEKDSRDYRDDPPAVKAFCRFFCADRGAVQALDLGAEDEDGPRSGGAPALGLRIDDRVALMFAKILNSGDNG